MIMKTIRTVRQACHSEIAADSCWSFEDLKKHIESYAPERPLHGD